MTDNERDADIGRLAVKDYAARKRWAELLVAKSPDAEAAHVESRRIALSLEIAIKARLHAN